MIAAASSAKEGVWVECLSSYPAPAFDLGHDLARLAADISGHIPLAAVSFGGVAGLYQQAGIPSIVCGPGDIARAHKPEEYITLSELHAAHDMVLALGSRLSA